MTMKCSSCHQKISKKYPDTIAVECENCGRIVYASPSGKISPEVN